MLRASASADANEVDCTPAAADVGERTSTVSLHSPSDVGACGPLRRKDPKSVQCQNDSAVDLASQSEQDQDCTTDSSSKVFGERSVSTIGRKCVPGLCTSDSASDELLSQPPHSDGSFDEELAPLTHALQSLSIADGAPCNALSAPAFADDPFEAQVRLCAETDELQSHDEHTKKLEAETEHAAVKTEKPVPALVCKKSLQLPQPMALAVQRLRWEAVCGTGVLRLGVLRISNISWDLSSADVLEAMSALVSDGPGRVPFSHEHVHIPIDRATGKTKADMYIELLTPIDALRCIAHHAGRVLRGRALSMLPATASEMHAAHFGSGVDVPPAFVDDDDAQRLVAICRNFKANFSRKCAERPFEHAASLLRLAAWERLDAAGRERVYRLAHGTVDALVEHLRMGSSQRLDMPVMGRCATNTRGHDLLARLQRAVRLCVALSAEEIADIDARIASYREEQRALLYMSALRPPLRH